jgi:hypothetical protein
MGQRQSFSGARKEHRVLPDDVSGAHRGEADLTLAVRLAHGRARRRRGRLPRLAGR